ncbi:HD domain-containing protein [candidate division FCPU426 bacterium]|nr:HD domain-containing protein [candidate division FCPU426 bacterium]
MPLFEKIKHEARQLFHGSKGSHDWEHTERVLVLALHLAEKEGADQEIVRYAAVLHDIGRAEEDQSSGQVCHAERGATMARLLLARHGLEPLKIERIARCIQTHRFRGRLQPETPEAKVLFDADKLDSLGAVGIGRAFLFAGEVGAKLHNPEADIEKTLPYTEEDTAYREYCLKLSKIKGRILTAEGRRLAGERHAFMENFFMRLNREIDGEW